MTHNHCRSLDPINVESIHLNHILRKRDNIAPQTILERVIAQINEDFENGCKRKLNSSVWDHFQRKMKKGKIMAICDRCLKDSVDDTKSGTTQL